MILKNLLGTKVVFFPMFPIIDIANDVFHFDLSSATVLR